MIKEIKANIHNRNTSSDSQNPKNLPIKRKISRNRSSILLNGNSFLQFNLPQNISCTSNKDKSQSALNNSNTTGNLTKYKFLNFKKTKSKFIQSQKLKQLHQSTIENINKSKQDKAKFYIFNKNLSTVKNSSAKFEKNQEQNAEKQNFQKLYKKTGQKEQKSVSKIKNDKHAIKNNENRSSRKNRTSVRNNKTSLFDDFFNNVGKKSTHFQEFLKQSNLKQESQKKQDQINSQNQKKLKNDKISNHIKNESIKLNNSNKQNESIPTEEQIKIVDTNKFNKILKSSLVKRRKKSHNQLNQTNQNQRQHRNLFQNLTQNNIIIDLDKQGQQQNGKIIETQQLYRKQIKDNQYRQSNQEQISQQLKKQKQLKNIQINKIEQQKIYKEQTEQLFRKLNRQIIAKAQLESLGKKNANFYQELRLKLTKKYQQISRSYKLQDKEKDNIALLIEGCNLQRHRRVNNFYFEKKMFSSGSRPQTANAINQATRQINNLNFVTRQRNKTIMRPQTSRSKSYMRSKSKLALQKSYFDFSDNITFSNTNNTLNNKTNQRKLSQKFSQFQNQSIFCLTNGEAQSSKMQRKSSNRFKSLTGAQNDKKIENKKQKQNLSKKFDFLIVKCQQQNFQHGATKQKMKAFEYYCSKIDNSFQKLAYKIKNYVESL